MKKKIVKITVADEVVHGAGVSIGAIGSHDTTVIEAQFSEVWQGKGKIVTWTNAIGEKAAITVISPEKLVEGTDNTYRFDVPAEATTHAGVASISIKGTTVDPETNNEITAITSEDALFRVRLSVGGVSESDDISASNAERLLSDIEAIINYIRDKVNNNGGDGEFVGIESANINENGELVLTYTNEETSNLGNVTGANGKDGADGKDGQDGRDGTPATHSWNGTTLTVTSASGTSSADLKGEKGDKGDTGAKGEKGDKGDTGAQGEKGVDGKDGADGENGKDGQDGYTPVKGTDYFTDNDKDEIVRRVITLLGGTPVFGVVDNNNNIILSGSLESGTYTLKYECADGSVTVIGTLEHTESSNTPDEPDEPDTPVTPTYTNLFKANTATLNTRMSGSSSAPKTQDGYVMTADITLPSSITMSKTNDDSAPYIVVPTGLWAGSANVFGKDGTGTCIGFVDAGATPGTTSGNYTKIPLYNQWGTNVTISSIVVSLYVKASAIGASDIANIEIYYNEIPE